MPPALCTEWLFGVGDFGDLAALSGGRNDLVGVLVVPGGDFVIGPVGNHSAVGRGHAVAVLLVGVGKDHVGDLLSRNLFLGELKHEAGGGRGALSSWNIG